MTNNADNFNNPLSVANGGTGIASIVPYEPLLGGTTSTNPFQQQSMGFSYSGYVLTSLGAAKAPIWTDATAGLIKLSSAAPVAAASVVFNNTLITSTYTKYLIVFNVTQSVNGTMAVGISTNNGGALLNTGFQSSVLQTFYSNNTLTTTSFTTEMGMSVGTGSLRGYVFLNLPPSANPYIYGRGRSPVAFFKYAANNSTTTTIKNF